MVLPIAFALLLPATPTDQPVKAFILAGQSNMVGHGNVATNPDRNGGRGSLEFAARTGKLSHLMDQDGKWRLRDDVRIHYFDRIGKLTVGYGAGPNSIGPELGFGFVVGDSIREDVLLIKIAWGGKSLAVDFRPPSSGGNIGPSYTELIQKAKEAVANAGTTFPDWEGRPIEVVGFAWHQGWNDRINGEFVAEYEENMANFIRDVRKDLDEPAMPFVIAETGMGGNEEKNERALALMVAQAAVPRHAEFRGNVAFAATRPFWRTAEESPSDQGYHWNNNAETYYRIGEGMGRAMLDLLKGRAR